MSSWRRLFRSGLVVVSLFALEGCAKEVPPPDTEPSGPVIEPLGQGNPDKIDLLFAIDDSPSMAEKQALLAETVPDLLSRLVNPYCVRVGDRALQATQPNGPDEACETTQGYEREFSPITNLHIGIVSSSLGGLGSDRCTEAGENDRGELVARAGSGNDPTSGRGFLAWSAGSTGDATSGLSSAFTDLVVGVNTEGCRYPMLLESAYRFLVDPKPYAEIAKDAPDDPVSKTSVSGVDDALLAQRADFLRDDAILEIVLFSGNDDCSIRTGSSDDDGDTSGGQFYAVLNSPGFFRASSACANDPNDPCCYSCGLSPPSGCAADPTCEGQPTYDTSAGEDGAAVRCVRQKERYGFDALYPVARYVHAFSDTEIDTSRADLAASTSSTNTQPNPLFHGARTPDRVLVTGIVGVPWQAIANTGSDGYPDRALGYLSNETLEKNGFWNDYVGNPDAHVKPTAAIMQEDWAPRAGIGAAPSNDAPNGGERTIAGQTALQYSCIFPLPSPIANGPDCGADSSPDDPVCDPVTHSTQVSGKAYPSLRDLALLRGLGARGNVASICGAELSAVSPSFGFRPAFAALVDRLSTEYAGRCMPRTLLPSATTDQVPCTIVEATHAEGGQVDCASLAGRAPVSGDHADLVKAIVADDQSAGAPNAWNSFCEIPQLGGDPGDPSSDIAQCENVEAVPLSIDGWCYVAPEGNPPTGNPNLPSIQACPSNERRLVRLVNGGHLQPGASAFISCMGHG